MYFRMEVDYNLDATLMKTTLNNEIYFLVYLTIPNEILSVGFAIKCSHDRGVELLRESYKSDYKSRFVLQKLFKALNCILNVS